MCFYFVFCYSFEQTEGGGDVTKRAKKVYGQHDMDLRSGKTNTGATTQKTTKMPTSAKSKSGKWLATTMSQKQQPQQQRIKNIKFLKNVVKNIVHSNDFVEFSIKQIFGRQKTVRFSYLLFFFCFEIALSKFKTFDFFRFCLSLYFFHSR